MKRAHAIGKILAVAAVVLYFAGVAAAGTHAPGDRISPAPAARIAHRAAMELTDLVLDGIHVSHRMLCGAAKLYARLCIDCTEIATDRVLGRRD